MSVLTSPTYDPYRLPTNVKPTHYDLLIKTDLKDCSFHGSVKINLHVNEETTKIVLNSAHLKLGKATLYSSQFQSEQEPIGTSFDEKKERVTYLFSDALSPGWKAQLMINFSGELGDNLAGYYRSSWKDNGKTKYYSLTQFEPTAARMAFPCWDEPLLKATFTVTLLSRKDTVNLSNMPVLSEEPLPAGVSGVEGLLFDALNEQWKITKFETTPLMSTYLVAFANGNFKYQETTVLMPLSKKTIPLRIYATPDVIHQASFVLDVKAAVLPLYEKIFDVVYPLPKLDTLAVSDFDAGAMENWGLITGRLSEFLLDPSREDQAAKMRIVGTESHEVAHMWFGNITTMAWWTYLYLNEGFATLMGEVIIPNKVFPDWHMNSHFISEHLESALSLDAKLSSHPIEVDCPDANHINQIFDSLSYSKAASVLRMLSAYVGEDKFLKGVSIYLKNNLFANTVTHDLWDGVSSATGINVTQIMDNWINEMGFPVLTVTETPNGIHVRQDRFLETGPADPKDNKTIWSIPLSLASTKDGVTSVDTAVLLCEREGEFTLDTSQPFKLNAGTTGVYRVLYTPERLSIIAAESAKENSIFALDDRMGLVQDAFALARAGFAKLSSALTIVEHWKHEKEYLVWRVITNAIDDISSIWWENPVIVDKLDVLRRSLYSPFVKKLGYEYSDKETMDISLMRTMVIEKASMADDKEVVNELLARFKYYSETGDDSRIPADLQRATFCTAVRHGGRREYDKMVSIYENPNTPTQKAAAIFAMCSSEDINLLNETTQFISEKVRNQDNEEFFEALGLNHKARRLLTKYLEDNYDILYKRLESNFQLGSLIKYSIDFYSSMKDLSSIEAFFKDKDTSKYNQALAQALDNIRARNSYVERSTVDLQEWLGIGATRK